MFTSVSERNSEFRMECGVPYRIDIVCPPADALDHLVELDALDIEPTGNGLAAIMPDAVTVDRVVSALRVASVAVSSAVARDNGSVWLLSPRAVRIGSVLIASWSLESEVRQAYQQLGMRHIRSEARAGWAVIVAQASW
jgi:hypothetical protein